MSRVVELEKLRGQIEAACFLRDSFIRDGCGGNAAQIVCSNYACLLLVGAGLATWEDLRKQDRDLIDFVPTVQS